MRAEIAMRDHKYRFGVNGNYLRTLFPRRIKRTMRSFPKAYQGDYVSAYFEINRNWGYAAFVGH